MPRKTVYNANLVTQEKWEQVLQDNKDLLEEFLEYKRSTGKSEETIYQYNNDIRIFLVWYMEKCKNKHFTEMKKRDIANFQGFLLNTCGMSGARIKRIRSSLSSMSNAIELLYDDEFPNFRNIINKIEAPTSVPVREKTIFTFEDCERVANKLVEDGNIQLACYLTVACYSGLRKQELTRLLVKDFTTNINMAFGGSFYKTSAIRVKGRGGKTKEKYVWNRCDKWLKLWLDYREKNNIQCEYLFCRLDKGEYKKLLVSTANSFATTLSRYFGLDYYNHSSRHCFSSELTRSGLPIEVVQFLLDHASSDTTRLYIDIPEDETMEKFNDFFSGKVDKIENKKSLSDL